MLSPARVLDDVAWEIMALAAHAIGPIHRKIGIRVEIRDPLPGAHGLAEFVVALQKVGPFRSVRTVRTRAAELSVVVAVVAIRAINLCPYLSRLRDSVQFRHIRQETGLRVWRGDSGALPDD